MKSIYQIFLKGLAVVLPVSLTVYLFIWLITLAESLFSRLIRGLLGDSYYVPGLGMITTLCFIFFIGMLVSNYFTAKIVTAITDRLEKVPFIKSIYAPLKDIMGLFDKSKHQHKRVVLVQEQDLGAYRIGLVTRDQFRDLPSEFQLKDHVSVYFPMSYMFGGYTRLISKERLIEVDIPVEQALKLAITGWVKTRD